MARGVVSLNKLLLASLLGVIIISAGLVGALYELSTADLSNLRGQLASSLEANAVLQDNVSQLADQISGLQSNINDLTSWIAQISRAMNYTGFNILTFSQCEEVGLLACGQGISSVVLQDPKFIAAENGLNYTYESNNGASVGGGTDVPQTVTLLFKALNYSEIWPYCGTPGPAIIGILRADIEVVGGAGYLDYANMSISQQRIWISCPAPSP